MTLTIRIHYTADQAPLIDAKATQLIEFLAASGIDASFNQTPTILVSPTWINTVAAYLNQKCSEGDTEAQTLLQNLGTETIGNGNQQTPQPTLSSDRPIADLWQALNAENEPC